MIPFVINQFGISGSLTSLVDGSPFIIGTGIVSISTSSVGTIEIDVQSQTRTQTFLSSSIWICPKDVYQVIASGFGGAGGGGGGGTLNNAAGGVYANASAAAAGGAPILHTFTIPVVPEMSYSITIGEGGDGAPGTTNLPDFSNSYPPGDGGQNTTFSTLAIFPGGVAGESAKGGSAIALGGNQGSFYALNGLYGKGGDSSSAGYNNISGGHPVGQPGANLGGGGGAAGPEGPGADGGASVTSGQAHDGEDALDNSGAGGGGGGTSRTSSGGTGGAGGKGGSGMLRLFW